MESVHAFVTSGCFILIEETAVKRAVRREILVSSSPSSVSLLFELDLEITMTKLYTPSAVSRSFVPVYMNADNDSHY